MGSPGSVPALPQRSELGRSPQVRPPSRAEPPRPAVPQPPDPPRRRRAFWCFVTTLVAICVVGAPYYLLPIAGRVRSPWHPWLKPSGYIGQSAGLLALVIFLYLWLYPLRKKFRWLAFTGTVARWLDVHVLVALALPLLVTIHAAWRFEGLIGLGFWSMMIVWFSGIAGRYIYARIPRTRAGVELTIEEIAARRQALLAQIAAGSGLDANLIETTLAAGQGPPGRRGIFGTL